tara:strand:- start:1277 stop:1462 length:186 start_codon:yes stop_codon:yes gene_type:complete
MKKRFPKKPFDFGKFVIEYRDNKGGILRFLKEHIDNIDDANAAQKKLLQDGYYEPVIKKIG